MRLASILLCGTLLTITSCRSVERFDTRGDAAYCGDLVGAQTFSDGFVADNVEPPTIRLRLTLDTSQLSSFSESSSALPGTLTSNDQEQGLCSADGQPLFKRAYLRAIPQVYHDALSSLSFGEGHDEDFFAWVDSSCQGTMLALVSLLKNGNVELRLFKPAALPAPEAGPGERPGFALFYMKRSEKGCEF